MEPVIEERWDDSWADRPAFLLFGDQSLNCHSFLAQFFRQPDMGHLSRAFLLQALHRVKQLVDKMPPPERAMLPEFRTLQQLNERYFHSPLKHSGMSAALLAICQIVHYLNHCEKHCGDVTQPHQTFLIGLCSGLWASSAISVSPSLPDLVHIGVQFVVFAFKTGTYVHSVSQQMSQTSDRSRSWTYIFTGLDHDTVPAKLDAFNREFGLPPANRAYVSAVSEYNIAISGPPNTLDAIVKKKILPGNPVSVPVFGPYHAPHIHSEVDVRALLDLDKPETQDALYRTSPRSPVMNCGTGTWFTETDTISLVASVASTVLKHTLDFTKVLSGCLEAARRFEYEDRKCLILPLGPTQNSGTLKKVLELEAKLKVTTRMPPPYAPEVTASTVGNHGSSGRCKLAIVGMAGRFPDAPSHEALWKLLEQGLDVHREVPPDRFDVKTHFDPTGRKDNTSHTPYGCWIPEPGLFDPRFFSMSPREAAQTDPMQRMALTTAYEALEMSGYVPNRTPSTRLDRIGTFYGQTSDDWREINAAQTIDTYFITGGVRAFGPGRINYHFGFSGPSLNIDTACSSSAAAMQVACTALWARDCDTAVVGGLSCMTNPDIFSGLSRGQFLSKTGPCATFDNKADGYCRGDGCASVVVKRLDDALADNDRILGVILGTATNHSADAISITHPHGPTQSILSTAVLDEAGVDPHDIDYVEMHGTGTQAGDGTEMRSVTNVFAPADRPRPHDRPLFLGSVKANVGHGEAASGITAIIKVLLMLEKNIIPRHVGIKQNSVINQTFPKDLSDRGVNIAFHTTPFKRRDGKPRRVFINNFSAAGGNTAILVEDPPKPPPAKADPRSHHIITLTGKAKASLLMNADRLLNWMERHSETPVSHISYSMTARKIQHYWRISVTGSDMGGIQTAIRKAVSENSLSPVKAEQPKVVMMFTGQGTYYAALGKEFYQHHSVFRKSIDSFVKLARLHNFPSFLKLIDGSEQDVTRLSAVELQVGLVCFQMALARLWASWGIKPAAVVGHSLGEYAALEVAGVLSASDVIYLVGCRAQLLEEKCEAGTQGMLAISGTRDTIMEALGPRAIGFNVACINGPREIVLSGPVAKIPDVATFLSPLGFRGTPLKVSYAFHSPQVEVILDDFEKLARGVTYNVPKVPVISTARGKVIVENEFDAVYFREHARNTVDLLGGLIDAQRKGTIDAETVWLEIGAHPVLTNMVMSTFGNPTVAVPTLRRGEPCYKTVTESIATLHRQGVDFDFNEYHREFSDSVRLLNLPSYAFDERNYWIQYTGDWCLTKHRIAAAPEADPKPQWPTLSTTSVQKITMVQVEGDMATVETESDLCQEQLRNAVSGHRVNGAPLCPSSLYGDMAMTVCDYAYKLLRPETTAIGCNVANMEVPKTLILDETASSHVLRLTVTANAKLGFADLIWHTGEGSKKVNHAHCKVYYGDRDEWQAEFDKAAYLIKSRVDFLQEAEKRGNASKIGRGLAYKLFSALVDYSPRYRGMEEVILDSATCEATAKVRFQTTEQDGTFYFSPYHIDSSCHISGFIINGTDAVDSREQVFISHGWGSMRFTEIPDANKEYRSYVRMQKIKDTKMMAGDAYVFDGDKIIGMTGDLKFQCIPRHVLNTVLPPRGTQAARAPAAAPRAPTTSPAVTKPPTKSPPKAAVSKRKKEKTVTPSNIGTVNQRLNTVVAATLEILARELGCGEDELADNATFHALGVDSLMGLSASSKLREELSLDIASDAFLEYPTIGAFKQYLARFEKPGRLESVPSQASELSSDDESPEMNSDSDVTTPPEDSETLSVKVDGPAEAPSADDGAKLRDTLRRAIAAEAKVEVAEVLAVRDLPSLGVDSIMGLAIVGRVLEEIGVSLEKDLFLTYTTLKEIEHALGIDDVPKKLTAAKQEPKQESKQTKQKQKQHRQEPEKAGQETKQAAKHEHKQELRQTKEAQGQTGESATPNPSGKQHPRIGLEEPAPPKPPRPTEMVDEYPHRTARSVLLSGTLDCPRQLFMIPDGSGSATSYTEIAKIGGDWRVWGLFSPFMKTPHEYHCGVYGMAAKFIDEMKRRQPEGPYSVAGWSAGGVIAYEMVYQLVNSGEEVEHLILIDAPAPITIEPLPQGLHAWFASIGLLGEDSGKDGKEKKVPEWLLPHFSASITALSNYYAEPIPKDKSPKTMAIWCEDGVCHLPTDPRPEPYPKGHALFLLDNRTDFGPNRWDEYLDVNKLKLRHMPGNHFTMIHKELVRPNKYVF
ncbi:hypothetical protein C7999DRAFT_12845 [Corynascus novoguineensis]|uniref:Polyketide synthase n=1 Tax=Corynascus novoguineensis TaxID=1126955 RepID=A0AAN7HRA8_9PEZI|nr:hypothetical protein C7999DRAFT_12845 [Corynascus novoguineensis]